MIHSQKTTRIKHLRQPAGRADCRALPDELGEEARGTSSAPIRSGLVARVKRQINMGIYEEDAKIDALLDRLAAELMTPTEDAFTGRRAS